MPAALQIECPRRHFPVDRSIVRAVVCVASAGIVVKAFGLFKEVAIADAYGRSDAMDAYLAAALIPGLLVNLVSESLSQAFVPTMIRVQEEEGSESAQRLFSDSMIGMCLLLAFVSMAAALSSHIVFPLIASHYSQAKMNLSILIFYALLPLVLITGVATFCSAALNSLDRFALPALAPTLISAAIIVAVTIFGKNCSIWAIVYGNLAGTVLFAAVVVWRLSARGYRVKLRLPDISPASREVARQYGPVLLSGAVASGGLLVDQAMAASLPAGSVSALAYANRFVSVVLTLLAGAVSTAILPHFSRAVARRNWMECRHTLRSWLAITTLVSVPLTIALIAASHRLIRATLQHGEFDVHDTAVVTSVLRMYAIQIPFFVCSRVCYRFLLSMRRTDLILYCGVLNLILDIVLNLLLMRVLGIAGIALATSLWSASTFVFLGYWSWKLLRRAVAEEAAAPHYCSA